MLDDFPNLRFQMLYVKFLGWLYFHELFIWDSLNHLDILLLIDALEILSWLALEVAWLRHKYQILLVHELTGTDSIIYEAHLLN